MKELAITQKQMQERAEAVKIAERYILKQMPRINGIAQQVRVTHKWDKYQNFADPKMPFTAIAMTQHKISLKACVAWCKRLKTLFKNVGEPTIYFHPKGMLLTIGFNADPKKIEQLEELFG